MSRDDGFPIADVDTGYFEDAKLRNLWQRLLDPDRMARAIVLHKATVLASWRQGCRVTVTEACPMWMAVDEDLRAALIAVHLLDRGGRLPVQSFAQWFDPARKRREERRAAGRVGGLASGRSRTADAERKPKQPLTDAEPVRPSVPTDRQAVPADARADLEAYLQVRFRVPTPAQRTFMDGYCRTFDLTGPERAAQIILSHPDDPIGALKDDLAAFRAERRRQAEAQERPKPRPRRGVADPETQRIAQLMREQDEQREQERIDRMLERQARVPA